MSTALASPFEGLPVGWQALFYLAFVVIVVMMGWTALLLVEARRWERRDLGRVRDVAPGDPGQLLWVFLVPALNEERVIADSVERLLGVQAAHKRIVVIDDGSDDRTGAILAERFDVLEVEVITRRPPQARQGKAAALNHAYGEVGEMAVSAGFDAAHTIVAIVDADGRLERDAPARVAGHFEDERIGGVQVQVRIYNRGNLLTWLQDVEFGVYGRLFQAGRSLWGTAGMGGNGQFNRLSALADVVDDGPGPWRDRLTEDQDLGLRLIAAGWRSHHELATAVSQQGLSNLRLLFRQRTRWSQGNLQALDLLVPVARASGTRVLPRIDLVLYGLMPFLQAIVGASLLGAIYLAASGEASFWGGAGVWQFAFFYALGFGGVLMGCIARGTAWGFGGALRGVLVAQVYAFYSWLLWPVLIRSGIRQMSSRRGWAKTAREAVD